MHLSDVSFQLGCKMTVVFVVLILVFSFWIVACKNDCITIGIIANGTGLVESETFAKHERTFVIVKHLVDVAEIFYVFRAVQRLDANSSVDVIILLEYDTTVLRKPQILATQNKKLIKLGARSRHQHKTPVSFKERQMTPRSCDTNDGFIPDYTSEETYCLTNLNITNMNGDDVLLTLPVPRAIRSLVKSLKWHFIIIFYESSTETETSALVDGLSKDGVLFAMYNTDHVANVKNVLQEIYQRNGDVNKEIYVVVVCRLYNTKQIIKSANEFDSLNNRTTLLQMFSRWLIVLYDYSRGASEALQDCGNDLDNIAILAVPKLQTIGIEGFYKGIDCTVIDILREDKSHDEFRKEFIDRLEKKAPSWNPSYKCKGYHIDTLLWKEQGRAFSSVGHADINGNIVVNPDIFPNTKYGYNRRSFLVSTLEYSPFVEKRKVNNSYIYEGFCMDLLSELANKLNFTYNLTEPADGKWGSLTNSVNITFNGLVGQLQKEEVDIVAAPVSVQAERDPVMDFSYPYYYEYTTVLVKKPDINATKWRTLIDPFKWEVLITIGASLLIVTILTFILEKYNPFYDIPQHAESRQINGGLHTWHSSFWYVFGALLCQGGVHLPESTSGRTLMSCWWLTCIIIVGTYSGNLIAFLTVTKERPPFNTLEEMNNLKGTYKWGTLGGTAWETLFPNSSHPAFKKMGEAYIEFSKTDPTILHQNPDFHVERVKKGKYAWIGDKTYMEIAMATECNLMSIKEEFMPLIYVFGFKNNSPHAAIFSTQMMKIHEGGLFQIWKRKWWPKSSFCAGSSIPEAKPISLMDVQSAFYVCLIGIFIGVFAFVIEILLHKYRKYRSHKQKTSNAPKSDTMDSQYQAKSNINKNNR
ncbi:glutamate receptor 2-like [Mercenaria mercenaria]|uniref:glutamate receptor 2-like n=1 Tax=Mercenaria mercenaria TaxID=6596 RepID=UPI00234F556E|nr:glutamate receptor 2-like [Mercenaria mercenaria]